MPDLHRAMETALDLLYPPQCLKCGAITSRIHTLCGDCWQTISFISAPCCTACGLPFDYDLGAGAICGECARTRPVFDRARAAFIYDDQSRQLILGFKHGDQLQRAIAFSRWMNRAGEDLITAADYLIPVPLHWTRLFARRFNQAVVLAMKIGGRAGKPVLTRTLIRRKRTPSQGRLRRSRRVANLRGAFKVPPGAKEELAGKRVLLIDDVLTTGATATACTKTLRRAGATHVDVLTLARVVRDRS